MKRFFDLIGSVILLTLLSPILVLIALAIKLTSPGPFFFIQRRIGLHGKTFRMFKFRTMINNAEKVGSGLYSYSDDPRITPIGRVLRRSSLDELPQLVNVISGSMSFVGPRPPVTYELGPWDEYTPEMRRRFLVKPGITGLAQVSGRNDLNWDEKIVLDNIYVDRFSRIGFFADMPILLRTLLVVISGSNVIETPDFPSNDDSSASLRAREAANQREDQIP